MRPTVRYASALMMSATVMLCACNDIDTSDGETGETSSSAGIVTITLATDDAGDPDYPLQAGGLVFYERPETVISLSPALTEMIYDVGGGDTLIAAGKYCDYPPEAEALIRTGSAANPDINAILALAPSLVISGSPIAKKDMTVLGDAGINVLIAEQPSDADGLYDEYLMLAGLFGGKSSAEQTASRAMEPFNAQLASAENDLGRFILIMDSDLSAATGDSFAGNVLSHFGENIAAGYADYYMPPGDIIDACPDTILLARSVAEGDRALFDETFRDTSAALNGRVYVIDTSLYERPTARLADELEVIRSIPPPE